MRLADIYTGNSHVLPNIEQARIYSEIPERAKAMGLKMWKLGDSIQDQGRRVLVGIDEAKLEAAELVDSLHELCGDISLEIFMLWDCKTQAEVDLFIPGIGPTYHVPVVGIWQDGVLLHKGAGHIARGLINAEIERLRNQKGPI